MKMNEIQGMATSIRNHFIKRQKHLKKILGENSMIKYGHIKVDLAWLL